MAEWLGAFTATLIPPVLSGQLGLTTLHTDGRVMAFAVGISAASAAIAALIPAFGTWRTNPKDALSDGGRWATSGNGARTLGLMVVAETAVTLVLIAGSGMMIQNFLRLRSQPLGFDARGLATLELMPPARAYPAGERATPVPADPRGSADRARRRRGRPLSTRSAAVLVDLRDQRGRAGVEPSSAILSITTV